MDFHTDYDRLKQSLCILEDRLHVDREDTETQAVFDAVDIGLNDLRLAHRAAVEDLTRRVEVLEAAVRYAQNQRS